MFLIYNKIIACKTLAYESFAVQYVMKISWFTIPNINYNVGCEESTVSMSSCWDLMPSNSFVRHGVEHSVETM